MKFQILNKEGEPVTMKALDLEAAEFWDKNPSDLYACPRDYFNLNNYDRVRSLMDDSWFEMIGYAIITNNGHHPGWIGVAETMMSKHLNNCFIRRPKDVIKVYDIIDETTDDLVGYLEYVMDKCRPHVDLINHWEAKGYVPVKL